MGLTRTTTWTHSPLQWTCAHCYGKALSLSVTDTAPNSPVTATNFDCMLDHVPLHNATQEATAVSAFDSCEAHQPVLAADSPLTGSS